MPTSFPSSLDPKSLQALDPTFARTVQSVMGDLSAHGWQPRIASGWRDLNEQAALKAAGRSTISFSFHNAVNAEGKPAALAVDMIDKRYGYNGQNATNFFAALGATAKARGAVWGGDWKSFRDPSHIQAFENGALGEIRKQSEAALALFKGITGGTTSALVLPGFAIQGWFEIVRRLPFWYWGGIALVGFAFVFVLARRHRRALRGAA